MASLYYENAENATGFTYFSGITGVKKRRKKIFETVEFVVIMW